MLGKKSTDQINARISSVIRAKDAVRVEGSVTGDVETEGSLIVSATGKVKGNVKGSSIIIGGTLEGDLTSGGRTEVASTGKVIGNIRTKSLVVDENAVFQGQCIMNSEIMVPLLETSAQEEDSKEQESGKDNNKWNKR